MMQKLINIDTFPIDLFGFLTVMKTDTTSTPPLECPDRIAIELDKPEHIPANNALSKNPKSIPAISFE